MEIKPFDNYQKTKSDCESIRITEEIKKKKIALYESSRSSGRFTVEKEFKEYLT